MHVEVSPTRDVKVESCVREAIWKLALPPMFTAMFEDHPVTAKL